MSFSCMDNEHVVLLLDCLQETAAGGTVRQPVEACLGRFQVIHQSAFFQKVFLWFMLVEHCQRGV
jgi:hypothetical protein